MMTSFAREWLKWSALVLMTADHVNKVLLDGTQPWMTDAARVVFPIFAVVLVYNVLQGDRQTARRALNRLLLAAVIAQPFHVVAFGYWLPLNVLFTLALGLRIIHSPLHVGVLLFAFGGLFVDYQWAGLSVMVATAWMLRHPAHWSGPAALGAAVTALYVINGNAWALAGLVLLWLLRNAPGEFPRSRWLFLGYYVGHLALLSAISLAHA